MDILDILRVPCEEFLTSKLHFHESPAKQRSGSVCQRCYNTIYLQINGTSTSAEQCHNQEDCIAVLNCYNYLINKLPQPELKPHLFNLPFSALERKNVEAVGPSCSTNISCSPELLKVTTAVDESCVPKKSLPAIEYDFLYFKSFHYVWLASGVHQSSVTTVQLPTNTETSHLTDSSEVVEVVRGSEQEIVNDAKVSEYLSVADRQTKPGSNTCQDKTKKTAVVEEKASIQIVEPTEIVQQPVNTHVVREIQLIADTPKKMSDEKTPAELGKECKGVGKVVQQLKNGVRRVIGNPKAHSSGTEYADRERNYPIFDNNLRDIWTFDGFRPIANIPHSVGLQNHGNTCFMNVIIQSLVHLPPFARFINDKHVHPNGKVYDECIACMFRQKIYQQAFSRHNGAIGVKWLLSLWPHLFRARFARQEADAHEFMIKLFDKIQKDIKRYFVYEGSSSGPIPSCPLEQIFYGKTREYSECICGASSARYENFCVYPLPVPDSNPRGRRMGVADLLELNGKKAPPVDFKCDKCGRYRKCGSVLYRCPSVLIFQIMCFRYTSYGKTIKIQQELYPEEVLSLKNFTFKNEEVTYDLSSVISHAGSINHGHYTSTTKGFDKKWYEFDDDRVRRCSLTGRSFYPYLLFYTRRSYPDRVYASPSVVLTPRELLKSRPSERSVGVRPASERQKKPTKLYSPEMKKSSTVQNANGSKKEIDVRSSVRMLPTNGSSKSSGHKDGRTCMPSSVTHPHKSYEKSNKARNGHNGSSNGKSQPTLSNGISSNGHATPLNCTVSEENIKLHNEKKLRERTTQQKLFLMLQSPTDFLQMGIFLEVQTVQGQLLLQL
ncbi:unnamed protein product [Nippostrongylus brasiliensis]|uniref:Ubiquitin carboxyl-terminal hydrolase n=1 Tax=Nippostrongylus brasiliensis TaxID=27835 RepID=A0A0N4YQN0_NIPBR|nr:unnamed protein product [Nippostrongylus brasiliensis]